MGSLFRSEPMELHRIILHTDISYECVLKLGELGVAEFRDLNVNLNSFQRKFTAELRGCAELERKLRYIYMEMQGDGIQMPAQSAETAEKSVSQSHKTMNKLSAQIDHLELELRRVSEKAKELKCNYIRLTELQHILRKIHESNDEIDEVDDAERSADPSQIDDETDPKRPAFCLVGGVISNDRLLSFERMLCRILHGHYLFYHQTMFMHAIEDCATGDMVNKSVFIAFCHGDEMLTRIKKISAGFRMILHPFPIPQIDRQKMARNLTKRIDDLDVVLQQTQAHRQRLLAAAVESFNDWSSQVHTIKSIYHTMNKFNADAMKNAMIAECWIPTRHLDEVQSALHDAATSQPTMLPILQRLETFDEPSPTCFITNQFTCAFQILVESFGVADYREMNPAPYTIVTIPFLFAVMFADIGHGLLMVLFALWMLIFCSKSTKAQPNAVENEVNWRCPLMRLHSKCVDCRIVFLLQIWCILFGGRYIILAMGLFSMYTGLIYNEFFSKSLNLFGGSMWQINYNTSTIMDNEHLILSPNDQWLNHSYAIGVDPIWQVGGNNKIHFQNSLKMKLSIVFGVLHMVFGLSLRCCNYYHANDMWSMINVFAPQLIFLLALFGYLTALILIKWLTFSAINSRCAPSILHVFIDMVLLKSSSNEANQNVECGPHMFEWQYGIQNVLMMAAIVCVPWMAFGRPMKVLTAIFCRQRIERKRIENGDTEAGDSRDEPAPISKVIGLTDVCIVAGIQTVEFVLGCISHTASYLRLWALSLAHARLTEMLWNLVLCSAWPISGHPFGGIVLSVRFAVWCALTLSILILMEGLSAFLHTLRLHWVEFQSKFYNGQGQAFQPFSFDKIDRINRAIRC